MHDSGEKKDRERSWIRQGEPGIISGDVPYCVVRQLVLFYFFPFSTISIEFVLYKLKVVRVLYSWKT